MTGATVCTATWRQGQLDAEDLALCCDLVTTMIVHLPSFLFFLKPRGAGMREAKTPQSNQRRQRPGRSTTSPASAAAATTTTAASSSEGRRQWCGALWRRCRRQSSAPSSTTTRP